MLTKTILNVPYAEKDQAKQLGAKWDPKQKAWYVPPGRDAKQFQKWLPKDSNKSKLLLNNIGLIRTITPCWSCKGFCTVHAIYAKELSEDSSEVNPTVNALGSKSKVGESVGDINIIDDSLAENSQGIPKIGFFILTDINTIPEALEQFLLLRCSNYHKGKINALGEKLYRNHCDHCSIGISDAKLHKKGKAFNPQKLANLKSMQFIDLLFFDDLCLQADFIDYSEHKLYSESIEFADYLTDYI